MNERDIELARSIDPDAWKKLHKDDEDWCQRFAELVRADERDACAALDFRKEIGLTSDQDYKVSQLILLRGNK